jgi:hypothetical protein
MWIFIVLAVISFVLGGITYIREQKFLAEAELYTGTITEYELYVRTDGISEYCPRIEFTSHAGEPVAVRGSICPNAPDDSKIGQTEQVYYNPQNPDNSYEVKSFATGYDGLIAGLIGTVFFGVLAVITRVSMKPRKSGGPARGGARLSPLMQQDAAKYRANQRKRDLHPDQEPPDPDSP